MILAQAIWIFAIFKCVLCGFSFTAHVTRFSENHTLPVVINTWPFIEATRKAWEIISDGGSVLDAVEAGCTECENLQCDGTVGYGGSPDETGETTLDAMIMDGETHTVGAVGALRRVKGAISVARKVMEHTKHTLLVGDKATDFALMMGFNSTDLSTVSSRQMYELWLNNKCQPNFWKNVSPNPSGSCGPYVASWDTSQSDPSIREEPLLTRVKPHDTIGMIAIDGSGNIGGGTSTNGANHKVPGRVGDSPVPGSGAYVDKDVGGAAATGDGDVMMRFMPSLITVENMRNGMSPPDAASDSLQRIINKYPNFSGAIVAILTNGKYGAACYNLPDDVFHYSVANLIIGGVEIMEITCLQKLTSK